jgi:predicted nucleic acid-binding Zn ribbon protein
MPVYPYACEKCEVQWEEDFPTIQKHQEAKANDAIKCPKCKKSDKIFRVIDGFPSVQYTTFGFYATDSKADKELARREKEKEKAQEKKYY